MIHRLAVDFFKPCTVHLGVITKVERVFVVNFYGVLNGVSVLVGASSIKRRPRRSIMSARKFLFNAVPERGGYVASKLPVLAITGPLPEEVPPHIDVALICPGLVRSELAKEIAGGTDTDVYAALVLEQPLADEFYVALRAFNLVGICARWRDIKASFKTYVPRHEGDDDFDVRTFVAKRGWYPGHPAAGLNLAI